MICKWCGEPIARSETACRRCGKDTPPLSDCGGFYDLVPSAREQIPVAPVSQQELASVREKKKSFAVPGVLCILLAVALVVMLITSIVLSGDNRQLQQALEEAEERYSQSAGQPLAKQAVSVSLSKEIEENTHSVRVACSHAADVTVRYDLASVVTYAYTAQLDIADARVRLTVDEAGTDGALMVWCDLDEAFGQMDAEFTLTEVTCTDRSGVRRSLLPEQQVASTVGEEDPTQDTTEQSAQELTQQPLLVIRGEDWVELEISYAYLRDLLREARVDEDTPLNCTLVRTSREGGSFTLVLEDISVPEE